MSYGSGGQWGSRHETVEARALAFLDSFRALPRDIRARVLRLLRDDPEVQDMVVRLQREDRS